MIEPEDENDRYYREQHEKHWKEMAGALLMVSTVIGAYLLYELCRRLVG